MTMRGYLKWGGRIGAAQAFPGSILKINPLVALKDEAVTPIACPRSWAKATEMLHGFVTRYKNIEGLSIDVDDNLQDDVYLPAQFDSTFPQDKIIHGKMSPVIRTHTGPHVLVVTVPGDK